MKSAAAIFIKCVKCTQKTQYKHMRTTTAGCKHTQNTKSKNVNVKKTYIQ